MVCRLIEEYVEEEKKIARSEGRSEGRSVGRFEGENEERNRWINVLIEKDFSDEFISSCCDLSVDEIAKYKSLGK